ncbi:hypothetical protein A9Q99_09365 [Gammaproteobacteria bacterium 45_16_T64]|nr:hypothetical protein A9Q99_09365 [Gammaproteobacteria bacterium 45_16_T64]
MDGLGYTREDIEEGFGSVLGPKASSALVQSRFWLLSLVIGAVPLVALILLGAFVFWLIQVNRYAIVHIGHGGVSWEVGLYLLCSLLSVGLCSALIQRVLVSLRADRRHVTLQRDQQPELYAFVEKISLLVGVPAPAVIKLDAQVGLLLKSKELAFFQKKAGRTELIIGLPLLYSLSVRQLAGVITHAFSGYDAKACLNGYPFIAGVNSWLYRISSCSPSNTVVSPRASGFLRVARGIQWPFEQAAQQLFLLLYRLSSAISFDVSRKMDMAADLNSAQITGSTEFRTTQFKLRALFYGQKAAIKELVDGYGESGLSGNYAERIVKLADSLKLELRPTLIREMEELVTPMSRSRVVDLGRIVNVERQQYDASCFLLGNATRLLNDLEEVSREVTIKHYSWIGINEPLASLRQVSVKEERQQNAAKSMSQTFCGWESSGRYIRIEGFDAYCEFSTESRVQDLQDLIVKISRVQDQIGLLSLRNMRLSNKIEQLHVDKTLTAVRLHLNEDGERANLSRLKEQELSWLRSLNEEGALVGDLSYYEALLSQRLSIALSLATESEVFAKSIGISDIFAHAESLTDVFAFTHRVQESVKRLSAYAQILGKLLEWQCRVGEPLDLYIERYKRYSIVELDLISETLGAVSYPFAGHSGQVQKNSVGEIPSITDIMAEQIVGFEHYRASDSVSQLFRVAHSSLAFIENLHFQLLAEVTKVALDVESEFNIHGSR